MLQYKDDPKFLTPLEMDVLRACYENEFNNSCGDERPCVWTFSVTDNCIDTLTSQVSGVVSSLTKKGHLGKVGSGTEACLFVKSDFAHDFATRMGWAD